MTPPLHETPRLLLKETTPEIWDYLFSKCSDEEIFATLQLSSQEELETDRRNWDLGMTTYRTSFKLFIMIDKATGKRIGKCGFHNWYALHSRAEIGYVMIDEEAKQKGLMTEAVRAIIKHGFEHMNLKRIEAFVGAQNVPSLKIVGSMGFTQEGVMRKHFFKNDVLEDSVCFSLLLEEYQKLTNS